MKGDDACIHCELAVQRVRVDALDCYGTYPASIRRRIFNEAVKVATTAIKIASIHTEKVGGSDGTRAKDAPIRRVRRLRTSITPTTERCEGIGGSDGTRTRGLRRDRPAF